MPLQLLDASSFITQHPTCSSPNIFITQHLYHPTSPSPNIFITQHLSIHPQMQSAQRAKLRSTTHAARKTRNSSRSDISPRATSKSSVRNTRYYLRSIYQRPRTFQLFSDLPLELRLEIWGLALQPRTITVVPISCWNGRSDEWWEFQSYALPVLLMQVCKEARDFVLRSYDRVYKGARRVDLKSYTGLYEDNSADPNASKAFRTSKSAVYTLINWSRDTIFLEHTWKMDLFTGFSFLGEGIQKVKSLAIPFEYYNETAFLALQKFSQLENLVLVDPYSDIQDKRGCDLKDHDSSWMAKYINNNDLYTRDGSRLRIIFARRERPRDIKKRSTMSVLRRKSYSLKSQKSATRRKQGRD